MFLLLTAVELSKSNNIENTYLQNFFHRHFKQLRNSEIQSLSPLK